MSEVVEKYKASVADCVCLNWARADYQSGFLSEHHSACPRFNARNELHILSEKLMLTTRELTEQRDQLAELARHLIDVYMPKKIENDYMKNKIDEILGEKTT